MYLAVHGVLPKLHKVRVKGGSAMLVSSGLRQVCLLRICNFQGNELAKA